MFKRLKQDITTLLKYEIFIYPLCDVKENNNNKKAFGDSFKNDDWKPKNIDAYNVNDISNALKNDVCGFYIKTGKKYGYFVIDFDSDKDKTRNIDLLENLKTQCRFYIKSPNGYHFYYKYEDSFNIKHLGVLGNIDIITNENVVFFGIRSDGVYSIEKADNIDKIPNDIKNILVDGIQAKKLNFNPISTVEETLYIDHTDTRKDIKYFIDDDELLTVLNMLPEKYINNKNDWFKISSILKKAGYKDLWDIWSKQSNKYNQINNERIFKTLLTNDDIPDLNIIINIINIENPTAKLTNILKIYKPYTPLSPENLLKITKTINNQYLNVDLFINTKDIIIKSSLGTGKTYTAFYYILHNTPINIKLLSICQLINNVNNHINDFSKLSKGNRFLYSYNDTENLKNIEDYDENPNKSNVDLCTTLDSLIKVYEKYFKNNLEVLSDYIIFMDEIHSDILHLLTSTTLNNKRTETLSILCLILKNCKQIIMTDGNISDVVLKFYSDLKRSNGYEFIINEYKSFQNIKVYFKTKPGMNEIMNDNILKNTKYLFACNTKKTVEEITEYTTKQYEKTHKTKCPIKIYTSTEGERIYNVNEEWDGYFIGYSPSIISGLDYKSKTPEDVLIFIDGKETINAEQVCQQVCRNRNIRNVYICYSKIGNTLKYNTLEELEEDYINRVNNFYSCPVFKSLCNKTLINYEYEYKTNDFTHLLTLSNFHTQTMTSNILYYISEILSSYGFIFQNKYLCDTAKTHSKVYELPNKAETTDNDLLSDDDKYNIYINNIIENVENQANKYNNQLNNRLKILNITQPNTQAEREIFIKILKDFKDILNNPHSFNNHLNIKHFFKSFQVLGDNIHFNSQKDFNEHFIKQIAPKLYHIKYIMNKYLKSINIYQFSCDTSNDIYNESLEMPNNEYQYIKDIIRTTKPTPTIKRDLIDLIYKCYKSILGDDLIIRKQKQQRINGKQTNFNIYNVNETYLKTHLNLVKYSFTFSKSGKTEKDFYDEYILKQLETLNDIITPKQLQKEHKKEIQNTFYEANKNEIEQQRQQDKEIKEAERKIYEAKEAERKKTIKELKKAKQSKEPKETKEAKEARDNEYLKEIRKQQAK